MASKRQPWRRIPPVGADQLLFGVHWIEDAVLGLCRLAHHQKPHLGRGIIEKAVRLARSGGKANGVTGT